MTLQFTQTQRVLPSQAANEIASELETGIAQKLLVYNNAIKTTNNSVVVEDGSALYVLASAIRSGTSDITDPLRERNGAFWAIDEDTSDVFFWKDGPHGSLRVFDVEEPLVSQIKITDRIAQHPEDFATFLSSKVLTTQALNKNYYDYIFDADIPIRQKDFDKLNSPIKTKTYTVAPEYNFFIDGYENFISNNEVNETLLPNLYAFYFFNTSDRQDVNNFRPLISLNNNIGSRFFTTKWRNRLAGETTEKDVSGRYYNAYVDAYKEILGQPVDTPQISSILTNINSSPTVINSPGPSAALNSSFSLSPTTQQQVQSAAPTFPSPTSITLEDISKKFKNIIFSASDMKTFNDISTDKFLFPMYVDFEFSTDGKSTITNILKDGFLMNDLVSFLAARRNSNRRNEDFLTLKKKFMSADGDTSNSIDTQNVFGVYNFAEWLNNVDTNSKNPIGDTANLFGTEFDRENTVLMSNFNEEPEAHKVRSSKFFKRLMYVIAKSRLDKFIPSVERNYNGVINGKEAYSETIAYKISKYRGNQVKSEPDQTFYIPNTSDVNVLKFADTQVKYSTDYTYVVSQFKIVVGSKYKYTSVSTDQEIIQQGFAIAGLDFNTEINIIEVPLFQKTTTIQDSPSVAPDVEVIPFRAVDNRIKLNLNANTGEYMLDPVVIESTEEAKIIDIRRSQERGEGPIEYRTDDPPTTFEVRRVEKHPESYQDFAGAVIAQLKTAIGNVGNSKSILKSSSVSFTDNIEKDKKYYYICRSIDVHGNYSYPTAIYEVELADINGLVYPYIQVVGFKQKVNKVSTKPFKKYLKISPAMQQTLINEERSSISTDIVEFDGSSVVLGVTDESLWGKKFKIRMTSKSTGKKIDINVAFTYKYETNENQE
jgi:hypothetical protein